VVEAVLVDLVNVSVVKLQVVSFPIRNYCLDKGLGVLLGDVHGSLSVVLKGLVELGVEVRRPEDGEDEGGGEGLANHSVGLFDGRNYFCHGELARLLSDDSSVDNDNSRIDTAKLVSS